MKSGKGKLAETPPQNIVVGSGESGLKLIDAIEAKKEHNKSRYVKDRKKDILAYQRAWYRENKELRRVMKQKRRSADHQTKHEEDYCGSEALPIGAVQDKDGWFHGRSILNMRTQRELKRMLEDGETTKSIKMVVGVADNTVIKYRRLWGLNTVERGFAGVGNRISIKKQNEMRKLLKAGYSVAAIAKAVGVQYKTAKKYNLLWYGEEVR